ncbi:MAG: hypothetical protein H7Z41_05255 [Cytophagales bacterium]|nr:hypothetical protein [Armatimonadota bacterium]
MRFFGLSRPSSAVFVWGLLLITASLIGCGGGGGGGGVSDTPSPTPTPSPSTTPPATRYVAAGFDLVWSARSRAADSPLIPAPASATSARVTLREAGEDGGDVSVLVRRRTNTTTSYSEHVTFARLVRVGDDLTLEARFFGDPDGAGIPVATGSGTVSVRGDGTGIGTISTASRIASVTVPADQSVPVGESVEIRFEARDASGALIPVPPGAAFFTVSPADVSRLGIFNGTQANGLLPGSASVMVTIDGVSSDLTALMVRSNAQVTLTPSTTVLPVLSQVLFSAQVTNAPSQHVTYTIREGASGGSITTEGVYTAPSRIGTFQVDAVSVYDPTKSASAVVTVKPRLTISPEAATLTLREQRAFVATVIGSSDTSVAWSVQEGPVGGTVTLDGVYTAPAAPGIYHLTAVCNADSSVQTIITITVQAGSGTVIIE